MTGGSVHRQTACMESWTGVGEHFRRRPELRRKKVDWHWTERGSDPMLQVTTKEEKVHGQTACMESWTGVGEHFRLRPELRRIKVDWHWTERGSAPLLQVTTKEEKVTDKQLAWRAGLERESAITRKEPEELTEVD